MNLDPSNAFRAMKGLSKFIGGELKALDKFVEKSTPKVPKAYGGKKAISEVTKDAQRWLKLIDEVNKAQTKIQKTRLDPIRATKQARVRQTAERRVFGAFEKAGGGPARIAVGDAGTISKSFVKLMNNLTRSRKELQQFSVSLRKNLTGQLRKTSKSVIDSALRFKRVENITHATFNRLWKAQKEFGDKSVLTAKNYFAKGILTGQRGMERFWRSIKGLTKKGLAYIFRQASVSLKQLGQTKPGKWAIGGAVKAGGWAAKAGGAALGGLGAAFRGLSGVAGIIGNITSALGPLGTVVGGIVKGIIFAKKAMIDIPLGIIQKAASFALLPLKILSRIHSTLQSISFTVFILWSMVSRTMREPLEVMKQVDVAMSIAEGSLEGVGKAMDKVTGYAKKYAVPIVEIAKGFYEVVRSGFNAAESMEILDAAMTFAVSTGGELNRAIDQVIGILRAFEMEVSEAASVVTVLHNAVGGSRASLADLQIALGYAGPAAMAAGLSFKEATAILTMFRDSNLRASRAGMTFRAGLDAIQRAIGQASGTVMTLDKAVKHLGLAWEDMVTEEGALDMKVIFEEFGNLAKKNLTIMDKLALRAIYQGRHWANWFTLLKKGYPAYKKRLKFLEREIDLTAKVLELNQSIWALGERLANVWTVFKIGVINEALPSLGKLDVFFKNLITFMDQAGMTIGKILKSTIFTPMIEFLEDHIFPLFAGDKLTSQMEKLGEAVRPVIQDIWDDINDFLIPFMDDIADGDWTGPVVGGFRILQALLTSSLTILTQFYEFFSSKWELVVENVLIVLGTITGVFEYLLPKAEELLTFALNGIIKLIDVIGEALKVPNEKIKEIQKDFEEFKGLLLSDIGGITSKFLSSGDKALRQVRRVKKTVKDLVEILESGSLNTLFKAPLFGAPLLIPEVGIPGASPLGPSPPPFLDPHSMDVEAAEKWIKALGKAHKELDRLFRKSGDKLSGITKRLVGEAFIEIAKLIRDLGKEDVVEVKERAKVIESMVGSVVTRIQADLERAFRDAEVKHEVEVKPSKKFEKLLDGFGDILDADLLKEKVEERVDTAIRRGAAAINAAYE